MRRRLNGEMPAPTRIEGARRRAHAAKRAAAVTAATGFVVALALVRQGHPATTNPNSTPTGTGSQSGSVRSFESDDDGGSTFGGGSIAPPSGGVAPVATSTS
jgi:hypothetical protein